MLLSRLFLDGLSKKSISNFPPPFIPVLTLTFTCISYELNKSSHKALKRAQTSLVHNLSSKAKSNFSKFLLNDSFEFIKSCNCLFLHAIIKIHHLFFSFSLKIQFLLDVKDI